MAARGRGSPLPPPDRPHSSPTSPTPARNASGGRYSLSLLGGVSAAMIELKWRRRVYVARVAPFTDKDREVA